jgi:hypothetical protein
MTAALAARAASAAGTGIAAVSFTTVLALVREHVAADACLPALRLPLRQRRRPPLPAQDRDRRTATGQGKQETNLRKNQQRTKQMANRGNYRKNPRRSRRVVTTGTLTSMRWYVGREPHDLPRIPQ